MVHYSIFQTGVLLREVLTMILADDLQDLGNKLFFSSVRHNASENSPQMEKCQGAPE